IGTPEEIVLTPASDYVAGFTAEIPRFNFISVGGIMAPPVSSTAGPPLRMDEKLVHVAQSILESEAPRPVADESGKILGSIGKAEVFRVLFPDSGREARFGG